MMNTGRKKPYLFKIFVFWTLYSIPRCTASWRILARGEGQLREVPVWRSTGLELISKLALPQTGTFCNFVMPSRIWVPKLPVHPIPICLVNDISNNHRKSCEIKNKISCTPLQKPNRIFYFELLGRKSP